MGGSKGPKSPRKGPPKEKDRKPAVSVVGIGASAGGLKALTRFLGSLPPDSGLAYVIVVHLSPEHESHLADLLQPGCPMPVEQVSDTRLLEPDRVYVIPPGANLNAIDTHLRLSALEEKRTERATIDHFFRTLAASHDGRSIGVVLTGSGSDGTLGLREIREQGGSPSSRIRRRRSTTGCPAAPSPEGRWTWCCGSRRWWTRS